MKQEHATFPPERVAKWRSAEGPIQTSGYNIYQIAKAAGVSIATVSRVLNNRSNVSPHTRRDVIACMKRLAYVPRRGGVDRAPVIGALLEYSTPTAALTAYVAEVIGGISHYADQHGLSLEVFSFDQPRIRERGLSEYLRETSIDGVVILLSNDRSKYIHDLNAEHYPCIVINNRMSETVRFVDVDNAAGARMALRHLADLGHRRIAFLGGNCNNESLRARFETHQDWLRETGVENPASLALLDRPQHASNHLQEGYENTKRLLDSSAAFSSLFCATDELAFGAIRALADRGFRVPSDISVVGFDDCEMASYSHPALTTVRQPLREMGSKAAHTLAELIDGYRHGAWEIGCRPGGIVEEPKLIVRESTGPVAR